MMSITLVVSESDPASKSMSIYLEKEKRFVPTQQNDILFSNLYKNILLYKSKNSLLFTNNLENKFPNSEVFIFLSKHQSNSKFPTLTCHFTGNFENNRYGGNPYELGISYPSLQKIYLQHLNEIKEKLYPFAITIEATHHGPTSIKKPIMFVEIGSTEKEWGNITIASLICDCILSVISNPINHQKKIGIGIGGTHYGSKFNNIIINSDIAMGHISSKYNLCNVNEDLLNQMITKCHEKITHIILDKKGLGNEKQRIFGLIKDTGLEILKI